MFFYLAKVLWFLLQPSTLSALLIGYGAILIWTGGARWGRRFVTIGAILLLVAGLSPLGNALILPLEDRFPRANLDDPPPPAGFIILGGAQDRLILEAKSRDTYENAAFLKEELTRLGELGPGERWLLITSAYHMPRAMGAFRAAGFAVEAWPVDYRTRGAADLMRPFDKVSERVRR